MNRKRLFTFFLCACVLALSCANIHAHLPSFAQKTVYAKAEAQKTSETCAWCWAQINAQSDDPGNAPVLLDALVFAPLTFFSNLQTPSAYCGQSLSSRAPPAL